MKFLGFGMRNNPIVLLLIFLSTGCTSLAVSQNNVLNSASETGGLNVKSFDCAASSLYSLCVKYDMNIPYDDCVHLLPKNPKGNNMLELKMVLRHLGFKIRAEELSAKQLGDMKLPCVVLLVPSGISAMGRQPGTIGHYMVLWPVDAEKVEILDYPRPPFTVNRNYWGKHLQTVGIESVPALICDRQ